MSAETADASSIVLKTAGNGRIWRSVAQTDGPRPVPGRSGWSAWASWKIARIVVRVTRCEPGRLAVRRCDSIGPHALNTAPRLQVGRSAASAPLRRWEAVEQSFPDCDVDVEAARRPCAGEQHGDSSLGRWSGRFGSPARQHQHGVPGRGADLLANPAAGADLGNNHGNDLGSVQRAGLGAAFDAERTVIFERGAVAALNHGHHWNGRNRGGRRGALLSQ